MYSNGNEELHMVHSQGMVTINMFGCIKKEVSHHRTSMSNLLRWGRFVISKGYISVRQSKTSSRQHASGQFYTVDRNWSKYSLESILVLKQLLLYWRLHQVCQRHYDSELQHCKTGHFWGLRHFWAIFRIIKGKTTGHHTQHVRTSWEQVPVELLKKHGNMILATVLI